MQTEDSYRVALQLFQDLIAASQNTHQPSHPPSQVYDSAVQTATDYRVDQESHNHRLVALHQSQLYSLLILFAVVAVRALLLRRYLRFPQYLGLAQNFRHVHDLAPREYLKF